NPRQLALHLLKANLYERLNQISEELVTMMILETYMKEYLPNVRDEINRRTLTQSNYNLWADYYHQQGDYLRVDSICSLSLDELKEIPKDEFGGGDSTFLGWTLAFLAHNRVLEGNYEDANEMYLRSHQCDFSEKQWSLKHLGDMAMMMGDSVLAQNYYQQVESKLSRIIKQQPNNFFLNNNLSALYEKMSELDLLRNNPEEAIRKMKFVLNRFQSLETTSEIRNAYRQLGRIYAHIGDYKLARQYYRLSNKETLVYENPFHYGIAQNYLAIAQSYWDEGLSEAAQDTLLKARKLLEASVLRYQDTFDFALLGAKQTYLEVLAEQTRFAYEQAKQQNNMPVFQTCFFSAQEAIEVLESIKSQYKFETDKNLVFADYRILYERLIWASHQLALRGDDSYLEDALMASDRSKSLALLDLLRKKNVGQIGDQRARSLIDREIRLSSDLSLLNLELTKLSDSKDQAKISAIQDQRTLLIEARQDVQRSLSQNYPQIYATLYDAKTKTLAELRANHLDRQTVSIDLFEGKEQVYAFALTQDDISIHAFETKCGLSYAELTQSIHQRLIQFDQQNAEVAQFASHSNCLYQSLFSFLEDLPQSKILMVPDGRMLGIPLEVMIPQLPAQPKLTWSSLQTKYLFQDYTVSYLHSLQLNSSQQMGEPQNRNTFATFTAQYQDPALSTLTGSSTVAQQLAKQFGSQSYTIESKSQFLAQASMVSSFLGVFHAEYDPSSGLASKIWLRDDIHLYASELMAQRLNSELAFFMSCDLNQSGAEFKPEVIRNFSYALTVSGVRSAILSSWRAADASAQILIKEFFYSLNQGDMTKAEALQNAKKQYFQANAGSEPALHPFYWASFIQYGDTEPIRLDNPYRIWFKVLLAGLAGMLFALFLRRLKEESMDYR
ncbi:MAG: CHAT domain-containing tetratricopeptide repeat protein, partial [Bacteroidota bacterium]